MGDQTFVENDVKVKDHCHITGEYKDAAYRDHNFNASLNHEIPIAFHNLKNYDVHLIMQELGKLNFRIYVIPNGLEKFMALVFLIASNFLDLH